MVDTVVVTGETLAEFNAQRLGVVKEAPKEEVKPEVKDEPKVEAKTDDQTPADDENETKQAEEPKRKGNPAIEQRFSQLSKARKDAIAAKEIAEARAKALEERVKAIEEGKPKPADPEAKPNPDSFKDAFTYAEALAKWSAENAIKAERQRNDKERAEKEQDAIRTAWVRGVEAIKKTHEDYEEVVSSSDVQVSDAVRDAILESDHGPLLIYHLAQNTDIADKLSELSPRKAILELGKLEATLTAKPAKRDDKLVDKLSEAPAPINPIRSSTGATLPLNAKGEFTGTYAEYKAARLNGTLK